MGLSLRRSRIPARRKRLSFRDRDLAAEGLLLLEGSFLVERGIAGALEIEELICLPSLEERWREALGNAGSRAVFKALNEAEISGLAGWPFHRGVLALARRPLIRDLDSWLARPASGGLLCLHAVADQENLGALIRSAAALGAAAVLIGPACADPWGRKALRASMGAALSLPLISAPGDPFRTLGALRSAGWKNLAASAAGSAIQRGGGQGGKATALWLGNEGEGLPEDLMAACDKRVAIPMSGRTDSLNVAAAGAILMWELFAGAPG